MYLAEIEYLPYIKSDNLNQIHQNNPSLLQELERVAIQKIINYTSTTFESSCLFPNITAYDSNKAYSMGEYVRDNNVIYVATADISAPNNISQFTAQDPRNELIKQWIIDIVLYDIHSRISPNQIPQLRMNRYNDCRMDLKEISQGLYGGLPDSCKRTETDANGNESVISNWGSEPKKNNYW